MTESERHSPTLADTIIAGMTEGVIVGDMSGNVLDMNPAALRLLEYRSLEDACRNLTQFPDTFALQSPDGRPVPIEDWPLARALRGETFTDHQVHMRRLDTGTEWWGSFSGTILRDAEGRSSRVVLTMQDVSALKRAEREMRYVTAHARCLLWFGTVTGFVGGGTHWQTQVFDEAAAQAFCPLDLLPGESYTDAWYRHRLPEGQQLTNTRAAHAFQAGLPHYDAEFGCRGRDGVVRWFSEQIHIEALASAADRTDPNVTGRWRVVGVSTDISERRRAEQALHDAVQRQRVFLRDVLASVTDGKLRLSETPHEFPTRLTPQSTPFSLSSTGGLRELRRSTEEAAVRLGFADERWHDLVTAVGEAGMNTVVHAGGGQGLVCADDGNTVQVWVWDEGQGIAVENLPHATLQKGYTTAGTMGHGMKMMLHTADRVWLLTGPTGTTVVIEQDRVVPTFLW